jgi:hypothetical protein
MLFSRALIIDSALTANAARARVREFATSRGMSDLEAFRRRRIIGWRLSDAHQDRLFQPEYGDHLVVDGARLLALVEPVGAGSRIRGRILVSPLTRIVMSVFILTIAVAAIVALGQGRQQPAKVLGIAATMVGGALLTLRYVLWYASRLVEARFGECLDAASPRAAA